MKIIPHLKKIWKSDYEFKTFFFSTISAFTGIGFTIFNAALGIAYKSVWNGTISVYYVLLAIVRSIVVFVQRKYDKNNYNVIKKVYTRTHIVLIFMDLCLIAPVAYMVMGERSYKFGLIPAITMAAYTTYRVIFSVIHYRSSRKNNHMLVKELRVINLQDALVAVLSLQNALIIGCGSNAKSMMTLTMWTSLAVWLLIVFFTVRSLLDVKSMNSKQPFSTETK